MSAIEATATCSAHAPGGAPERRYLLRSSIAAGARHRCRRGSPAAVFPRMIAVLPNSRAAALQGGRARGSWVWPLGRFPHPAKQGPHWHRRREHPALSRTGASLSGYRNPTRCVRRLSDSRFPVRASCLCSCARPLRRPAGLCFRAQPPSPGEWDRVAKATAAPAAAAAATATARDDAPRAPTLPAAPGTDTAASATELRAGN